MTKKNHSKSDPEDQEVFLDDPADKPTREVEVKSGVMHVRAGHDPVEIKREGEVTIVVVNPQVNAAEVMLPSDAEIGDIVEIHSVVQDAVVDGRVLVRVPEGQTLTSNQVSAFHGRVFRKVLDDLWVSIGSP